jgi:hypothetical protein
MPSITCSSCISLAGFRSLIRSAEILLSEGGHQIVIFEVTAAQGESTFAAAHRGQIYDSCQ